MPVYVDSLVDHGWELGPSCHLVGDTLDELHAFAVRIGMKRAWFQAYASTPHYDLTRKRRKAAVEAGAVELERRAFAEKLRELRLHGDMSRSNLLPWGARGRMTGAWQGPVLISALGQTPILPVVALDPGQTIEYWLVIESGAYRYEWRTVEGSPS